MGGACGVRRRHFVGFALLRCAVGSLRLVGKMAAVPARCVDDVKRKRGVSAMGQAIIVEDIVYGSRHDAEADFAQP